MITLGYLNLNCKTIYVITSMNSTIGNQYKEVCQYLLFVILAAITVY